jgi:hypothetical protein
MTKGTVSRQLFNSFGTLSDLEEESEMDEEAEAAEEKQDGTSSPRKRKGDSASSTHRQSVRKPAPPPGSQPISNFFKSIVAPSEGTGLPIIPEHSTEQQT